MNRKEHERWLDILKHDQMWDGAALTAKQLAEILDSYKNSVLSLEESQRLFFYYQTNNEEADTVFANHPKIPKACLQWVLDDASALRQEVSIFHTALENRFGIKAAAELILEAIEDL